MILTKETYAQNTLAQDLYDLAQQSYVHGSPWNQEQFQTDLENPYSRYLIWVEAQAIVAFIAYHQILDEFEIMHVVVSPAYQGQKKASELLLQLREQAQKTAVDQIFLEVRASNHAARHLYEKAGFEILGQRKNYYHEPEEDAILMVKKVKEGTKK